jgi:pimeloyl-ACP methyl ester carboxylesterase
MPRKKTKSSKKAPPTTGYSRAAKTVLQEGASRVQEMHGAIAGKTFTILKNVPVIGGPARLVQQVHDAITDGVYAAIRHGGGGLLDIAGAIERHDASNAPAEPSSRLARTVRSALNAAFGDHFADTNSVLAIAMGLRLAGRAIPLEPEALARAYPAASGRLCLFVHGLGCDEHCWEGRGDETDMPRQLAADMGYTVLTLRYNTGLPIVDNGAQLAVLLDELLAAWPQTVHDLVIIGHSMGALVARSACAHAAAAVLPWLGRMRMVACLGSPNLGSPVEKLGHLTTMALGLSAITEPLARIAARRSQGIQDLRHGLAPHAPTAGHIAWRFVGGSLVDDPNNPLGEIIGDGLVTLGSATAHEPTGDVQSVRLGGVGHLELLNDARVYAQIVAWLRELPAATPKPAESAGA